MTVQKVKALINRLYKLNSEINLTYISQKVCVFLIVRHKTLEDQPKHAIPSIENVFAFFERGYIVHYKTK